MAPSRPNVAVAVARSSSGSRRTRGSRAASADSRSSGPASPTGTCHSFRSPISPCAATASNWCRRSGAPPPTTSSSSAAGNRPGRVASPATPSSRQSARRTAPSPSESPRRSVGPVSASQSQSPRRSVGPVSPSQSRGSSVDARHQCARSALSPRPTWRKRAEAAVSRGDVRLELAGSPGPRCGGLQHAHLRDFKEWLLSDTSIVELVLCWSNLGDRFAYYFAGALSANQTLTKLDLSMNSIGSIGAKDISNALLSNTSLQELHLGFNKIGNTGALQLAASLAINRSLRILDLCDTGITAAGAEDIGSSLLENRGLQELLLGCNKLGCEGAKHLALGLKSNTTLSVLRMYSDRVGDAGAEYLAEALAMNSTLQELDLQNNMIGDRGLTALTRALPKTTSLQKLEVTLDGVSRGAVAAFKADSSRFLRPWARRRSQKELDEQENMDLTAKTLLTLLAQPSKSVLREASPGKWEKVRPPPPPVKSVVRTVLKTGQLPYGSPPPRAASAASSTPCSQRHASSVTSTPASSPAVRRSEGMRARADSSGTSATATSSATASPMLNQAVMKGGGQRRSLSGSKESGHTSITHFPQSSSSSCDGGEMKPAPASGAGAALGRAASAGSLGSDLACRAQGGRRRSPRGTSPRALPEPYGSVGQPAATPSCPSPRNDLRGKPATPADATRRPGNHHARSSPDIRITAEKGVNPGEFYRDSPIAGSPRHCFRDSPLASSPRGSPLVISPRSPRSRAAVVAQPSEGLLAMYWPSLAGSAVLGSTPSTGPSSPRDGPRPFQASLRFSPPSSVTATPECCGSGKLVDFRSVVLIPQEAMDDNPQQGFNGCFAGTLHSVGTP